MRRRRTTDSMLSAVADKAVSDAVTRSAELRFGEVTSVDSGAHTLTCTVAGSSLRGVPYMSSYTTPTIGDVVWLLHQGSTVVALGKF